MVVKCKIFNMAAKCKICVNFTKNFTDTCKNKYVYQKRNR